MPKQVIQRLKPLGGRPRDPIWAKFTAISERHMRCNKCLKIVTKKVDRLKAHAEACSVVVGEVSSDDEEQSEKKPVSPLPSPPAAEKITQPSLSVNSNEDAVAGPSDSGLTPSTSSGITHTDVMHSPPVKKHCKTPSVTASGKFGIDGFVTKTTDEAFAHMQRKWANFFYTNRLSFLIADDPSFHEAIESTRPGIGKKLLSRNVEGSIGSHLKGKMAVVCQDGWSNVNREPIVASSIYCDGKTFPLDYREVGSDKKTADYCFQMAKQSIETAENDYNTCVIGFVCDNEAKMKAVWQSLQEWRPQLVVFGCSAHYLNLVETVATPHHIMGPIVKINRFFREHHQPAGWLKEKDGMMPQLPNNTRWTSQRAALHTFVRNHSKYVKIRDEQDRDKVRFIQPTQTLGNY